MHETSEYNELGTNPQNNEDVCARHTSSQDGDTYKILYVGTEIYHPTEHKRPRRGMEKKLKSVTKEIFDGYLSFLSGREERKYRQISRIYHG